MTELREKKIGNIFNATGVNHAGNVYDTDYLAPCLNAMKGGYRQPMILEVIIDTNQASDEDRIH